MRRRMALVLAAAMAAGAITGCSGGGSTGKKPADATTAAPEAGGDATETEAQKADPSKY